MKRILMIILSLIVAISLAIPLAMPVVANTSVITYLGTNVNATPFTDARVRLAVYLALDRDAMAASQGGDKVVSIIMPSTPNPMVNRSYNPILADQLLSDAGYPNGFTTNLYTTSAMQPLANIIKSYLLPLGINATVITLDPVVFMSYLNSKSLPFFLTNMPVDNTIAPYDTLGRLFMSISPQNFTGYNSTTFDSLFNAGNYPAAENCAFGPDGLAIVPLFYKGTSYYTVRVQAASTPGLPLSLPFINVPVTWSKTGGLPPNSGAGITSFNIFQAGGSVTLNAPLNYSNDKNYYVFKEWLVGTPPAGPDMTTTNNTLTFTPVADRLATARYEPQITSLGQIFPTAPDVNPVGITHKVWVNIGIPVAGIKVMFKIDGPNSAGSDFACTDATGKAEFTYTGNYAGFDIIRAYIDSNGNGQLDTGEPSSTNLTAKSWVENYITGGGNIKENNKVTWTFNANLYVLPEGGVGGRLNITNHDSKVTYQLDEFAMLSFYGGQTSSPPASNNTARINGTGTGSDGSSVVLLMIIEDASDSKEKIAIVQVDTSTFPPTGIPWIGNIPVSGTLPLPPPDLVTISGGNFQIHNMK